MALAEIPAENHLQAGTRASKSDQRLGQTWRPLQRIKNDALFYTTALALFVVRLLPARALRSLARSLGAWAYQLCTRERKRSLENLERCFPDRSESERRLIAERSFRALGLHLGDCLVALDEGFLPLRSDAEAQSILRNAASEGKGILFLSGHVGAWERIPTTMREMGYPMTVVARASYDRRFTRLYDRLRKGTHVIYRDTPRFTMQFAKALRDKAILGLPIDLVSRGVRTAKGTLFGQPVETPAGPFEVAKKRGIPMIAGFAVQGKDGEELLLFRLSEPSVDEWHRTLEIAIQKNHLAWCWMHDRFR